MTTQYTFFWLTGNAEVIPGRTPADAMHRQGYGLGALAALDFYAQGDKRTDYRWNDQARRWESIKQERSMTNIERAAGIIDGYIVDYEEAGLPIDPDYIARALADAGYLMPDLPEPDNTFPEWRVGDVSISADLNTGEVDIEWDDREDTGRGTVGRSLHLDPDQVLAFIAAANYAEGDQA